MTCYNLCTNGQCLINALASNRNIDMFSDLSGLTLQSGPSRSVKDEYSISLGGMDLDGDMGMAQTIQHHPGQYSMSGMAPSQPGMLFIFPVDEESNKAL